MKINCEVKLTKEEVFDLLTYFDDSSDIPLSAGLDFDSYSEKLSKFAYFVLAIEGEQLLGFIAYYLNEEGNFVYVPQIVVHRDGRHQGIGHLMIDTLSATYRENYQCINLEVLKDNFNAISFYEREGFIKCNERETHLYLSKKQ